MKKRKVFRAHPILLIEGRIFILLSIWFFSFGLYGLVFAIINSDIFILFSSVVILVVCCIFFKIYMIPTLYPLSFGKLIITTEGIEYHCFLKKRIHISWDDCKYCGIESYKSDIPDLYNTGRVYIYFSKESFPREYIGKIDKKKNDENFIKFFPVSKKICEEVLKYKSFSDIRQFLIHKSFRK